MAVLRIAKMGNPVLLQKAAPVLDPTAPEIRQLAADMQETLEDIGASGLAAPQVFASKRVVVYRMIASRIPQGSGLHPRPWTAMINPVITPKADTKTPVWERCLSIPGLHGKVPRFVHINITYQDGATFVRPLPDGTFLVADWADRVDRCLRRQGPAEGGQKGQHQRADGSHSLSKPGACGKLRR